MTIASSIIGAELEIGKFIEKEKSYYLKDPYSNQIFKIPESQVKKPAKRQIILCKSKEVESSNSK